MSELRQRTTTAGDAAAAPPAAADGTGTGSEQSGSGGGGGGGNSRLLLVVFVSVIALLFGLYKSLPALDATDAASLQFPIRSMSELHTWNEVIKRYQTDHYAAVLIGFCAVYIFLQMFAIPGAIFLSVLAGPLFGVIPGLAIVSIVATSGSAMCYGLSHYLGRGLVQRCLPQLLEQFRRSISAQRHNLFWYLLFLRVSPILPNWFINIGSPVLDIPISTFTAATFVGQFLPNYLHVTTGMTLSQVKDLSEITSNYRRLAFLFGQSIITTYTLTSHSHTPYHHIISPLQ